ncbi:hypothetical protein DYBT9623_04505 [Dyadobacter sp. CECT 9623]|uniref:Outer membrane protein beta-barrel domain-containing protein n=1 Tax=Dyadobacter linearis TaxID=2823330 RepID=A0ABN7RGM5_9BACT|nr:hypothetical protein [Dyadobacter sp. CECT 9623]CAG5072972.1 hypothetical protein DYBT9623_04505 [Dyadobacter sp. CECT 9623]
MRYFILLLLTTFAGSVSAQTASDQIYKLDKSTIQAVVDEIGDVEIIYFLPKDTAKRTALRILRKQVWKIVYENGETELINAPSVASPVAAKAPSEIRESAVKPDRIFLANKTMITGKIIKVTEDKIEYTRQESGPIYEVARKNLARIEYGNGQVEDFGSAKPVKAAITQEEVVKANTEAEVTASKTAKPSPLAKLSVTVGVDGNYLLGSKVWTDREEGAGLMTLLGGSIRGNYQLGRSVAAFLTIGYSQASVQKNYLAGEELIYKQKLNLAGPSAGIGLKYFIKESLYVMAQGKGNFLKAKTVVFEDGEETKDQLSATCPSFSLGLGFTRKITRVIVEAEVHYQLMQSTFDSITDPFHMVGARVGIGMAGFGKK